VLVATQAVNEGSAFLRNLLLARLIGVEEMGLAVMLALGIRIFEMTGELGLDRLLVQVDGSDLPVMRRSVHLLQLVKGALLTIVAVLLAVPICQVLGPGLDASVFAIAALSLFIRGASNCNYRERQRRGEFIPAFVVEGGSNLIAALLAGPIAWYLRDYMTIAWVSLIQAALFTGLSHLVATSAYRIGIDRSSIARCFRFGVPIAVNGILMFLALQGDRLIVALNFPAADVARFVLAAQLTLLPALIGARFLLSYELPKFARLHRKQGDFMRHLWSLVQKVGLVSLVGVLLFGIVGNTLISWLYGDSYLVAAEVMWLLALGAGIRFLRAVPSTALMAQERTHVLLMTNLPRLITLPLAFWLVLAGGDLTAMVAIGVIGELMSLVLAFYGLAGYSLMLPAWSRRRLAEGS
jgi:O-antigen/teichoic acid export membrane protein